MTEIKRQQAFIPTDKLFELLRANPAGMTLLEMHIVLDQGSPSPVLPLLNPLVTAGHLRRFGAPWSRGVYAMADDPWYHEPKQRVMRRVVLSLLQEHMAGYSQHWLCKLLHERDKECDREYTRNLLARMLDEGSVVTTDGTEEILVPIFDTGGALAKETIATHNEMPIERAARVFRLTASRWLKDTSNDT